MESINSEITYFDSPGRSSITEINREKSELNSQPLINQILEGYPNLAVILNKNRQIIQYNKNAEKLLFPDAEGKITGQRMGEAPKCIHAFEMNAGCGTSKF